MTSRPRHLIVQWNESGAWIPAVREDLLDICFEGDTRGLPEARFRTPQAALRYLRRMRGMVHCGTLPDWRLRYAH